MKKPLVVYLAGGMGKCGQAWRQRVRDAVPHVAYLDPCLHGLTQPEDYVPWDLAAVRMSNLVFAYVDAQNAQPFGLTAEVAYACALDIPVILVVAEDSPIHARYNFVPTMVGHAYPTLQAGIAALRHAAETPRTQTQP